MADTTKINVQMNSLRERKNLDWFWLSMVFLLSINLYDKANFLFIGLLLTGLIVMNYKQSGFKPTFDLWLLAVFSLTYFSIIMQYQTISLGTIVHYFLGPIGCFSIGYSIVKSEKQIISRTIIVLVIGNFIYGFLNMLLFYNSPDIYMLLRVAPDVWTEKEMTATIQGTYFTPVSSLLFYSLLLLYSNQKKYAIPLILAIIFSIYSSMLLGNRTLILIVFITFGLNVLLFNCLASGYKRIFKTMFLLGMFFAFSGIAYTSNIFGLQDILINSQFYTRFTEMSISEDPRIVAYTQAMIQMFDYPLGGYKMRLGLMYAHNLWFDVLYATGLIPFFFLVLYTIKSILTLWKVIKHNPDLKVNILIFSIYSGYLLNFMVEPILEGVPFMFISFCLINGMIRKYLDIIKTKLLTHKGNKE